MVCEGPTVKAKAVAASESWRLGGASLGKLEESASFMVITVGPAKKGAGLAGSPASITTASKLEQQIGKQF